jgi:hypothetical protein
MTIDQNNQTALESRLKEMGQENELLLLQLHKVQEELERYYLRNQVLENGQPASPESSLILGKGWVDDELLGALTENQRLRKVVDAQRKLHQLERQNALNAKLGNLLIQGVGSPKAIFALPGKLAKIWRSYSRLTPPASLGGKAFAKVIAVYGDGGFDAVEKLMVGTSISPVMQANGYTVLARHLMSGNHPDAVEAARRAHALDPMPYRLKWLAFRLHEAGDLIEAEAMLDILPPDTSFSESEARQANQLRHEAARARERDAKQKTGHSARRAEVERQLDHLARERDEQSRLAAEYAKEVTALKQSNAQLETERLALAGRNEQAARLATDRAREVEAVSQANAQLEHDRATLEDRLKEAAKLVADRANDVEALKQANAQLEHDKVALEGRFSEATRLAGESTREIAALQQAKAELEHSRAALEGRLNEAAKLAADRANDLEVLKQTKAQLEHDRAALEGRFNEATRLAGERTKEIETLKQSRTQLERDKVTLEERLNEAVKLASRQQLRQQLQQEEMVRAEAQLELIKDIFLLREHGLWERI